MKITELRGGAHVFTLKDGKTLRVFPYSQCEVKDNLISKDLENAVSLGLILMTKLVNKKKELKEEETEKKVSVKKLGGAK